MTLTTKEYLAELVAKARAAQKVFETYSQEQVDKCVRDIGKTIYDHRQMHGKIQIRMVEDQR